MQLIERDSFLEVLRSKFKTVAQGEGHCVLVAGEAGIGKTSLVKAFTSEIREDCIVYQGSCDALFTPRPLAPLYDIIWQVNENFSPGNLNIEERTALFANFFIELTKQSRRIVILFEDIHWADKATLDFIKFLARRITQLRCLFVLTFREDDSAFLASIRNITSQLLPETFTRLELTSLSRESVTNMALNKGYNGEDVFSISNGNPFYVNEILANYSPGVPEKIKDAILAVYDRQQEGTKKAWQIFSVIPEGLEVNRFAKLKNSWDKGMDHCFALNIILVANNRVIFKHELYRRTIETSLPPFKRIALNKAILDLFLSSFEKEGDIRRIVHYAKNSNESDLVLKYAPIAAKQAAALGAHVEAARLYLLAIEHEGAMDQEQLLLLYDAYSFECYLTNQVKEAIIYATKSLKLWKSKGDLQKIGDCLCLLTRLWITDDNLRNAENAASEAINLLQNESSSKTKGKAFSLMAQLKNLLDSQDACILWGEKALIISQELSDRELESEALGLIGSAKIRMPGCKEEGLNLLKKSLQIASDNSYEDYVGTAYRNLAYNCIIVKEYALAREAINLGIAHCEDHNLDLWRMYLLSLKLKVSFDQGEWSTAYNTAKDLAERESGPKMMRIVALTTLATIDMRRGNFEPVLSNLLEALEMAIETMELQRITQPLTALLEYEWITNVRCIENMFI